MPLIQRIGGRKFILGETYLVGCFVLFMTALLTGATGWDAVALASIPVAIASGLGVIVWGNVAVARAANGKT